MMGDWTDDLVRSMGDDPPAIVSLMDVLKTSPCLPYDAREIKLFRNCAEAVSATDAELLRSGGIFVDLSPVRIAIIREAGWFKKWSDKGLIYISVKHLWPTVCAVIKVDAGRGFFGRQRVAYHVFASRDDEDGVPEQFSRGPVFTNPVDAFEAALALFRAAEIVNQTAKGMFY